VIVIEVFIRLKKGVFLMDKNFNIVMIAMATALFVCMQMLGFRGGWQYDRELSCEKMLKEKSTLADRQHGG